LPYGICPLRLVENFSDYRGERLITSSNTLKKNKTVCLSTVSLLAWLCYLFCGDAAAYGQNLNAVDDFGSALIPVKRSMLTIGVGADGQGTLDSYIDLEIGFKSWLLNFFYAENNTPYDKTSTDTRSYLLGVSSNPINDFFIGGEYGYWGRNGELTINSLAGVMGLNFSDWSVSLLPQLRAIKLYTIGRLASRIPQINIGSPGYGVNATYYGFADWIFSAGYFLNYYSENLRRLADSPLIIYIFSPSTLQLASGFEKSGLTFDATYILNHGTIGVDLLRSRSAIDNSVSNVIATSASWDLFSAWQLQLRIGAQGVSYDDSIISFAGLAVSYRW